MEDAKIPSRTRRKVDGTALALSIILSITCLPVALVGLVLSWIGRCLRWPLERLCVVMLPATVRLWYIHRIGRLHPWHCAKSRAKQNLLPHSRSIRLDLTACSMALVPQPSSISGSDEIGLATSSLTTQAPCVEGGALVAVVVGIPISVHVIPQLHDNYAYLILNRIAEVNQAKGIKEYRCCIIDASCTEEIKTALDSISSIHYRDGVLRPEAILTTHHHWDHMGANDTLPHAFPSIQQIVGGAKDRVLNANRFVKDGDVLELIGGIRIVCEEAPAHTLGSIVYRLETFDRDDCYFMGDTWFLGGSGALFEGNEFAMEYIFRKLYFRCKPRSLLFAGHEYSERILTHLMSTKGAEIAKEEPLRFQILAAQYTRVAHLRSLPHPAPTIPVYFEHEVCYNPQFLPSIKAARLLMAYLTKMVERKEREEAKDIAVLQKNVSAAPSMSPIPTSPHFAEFKKRMRPKIALSAAHQFMLVEPPWIFKTNVNQFTTRPGGSTLDAHPLSQPYQQSSADFCAPIVVDAERGFEGVFHSRSVPRGRKDIVKILAPLITYRGHDGGKQAAARQPGNPEAEGPRVCMNLILKIAQWPLAASFPGFSQQHLRAIAAEFAPLLPQPIFLTGVCTCKPDSKELLSSDEAFALSTAEGFAGDYFCSYGTSVEFDKLVDKVVRELDSLVVHTCALYGKKAEHHKRTRGEHGSASAKSLPKLDYQSETCGGGSFLTLKDEGRATDATTDDGVLASTTTYDLPPIKTCHDFTDCALCQAQPIFLNVDTPALVHQSNETHREVGNGDVMTRRPTTLTVEI